MKAKKLPHPFSAMLSTDDFWERVYVHTGEIQSLVYKWQQDGAIVCMTNGCFDLFHPGHAAFLKECRRQVPDRQGRLIVAINNDQSVARLKGPGRPLVPLRDRAMMVASQRCVDAVAVFGDDSAERIIQQVKPHVLCKCEKDFKDGTIVGADIVSAYGGRIVPIRNQGGWSTTGLIMHILQREGETYARTEGTDGESVPVD